MAMNPPVVEPALDADGLNLAQLLAHGVHFAVAGLLLLLQLLEAVEHLGELLEHAFQRVLDCFDVLDDGLHRGGFGGRFGWGVFDGLWHGGWY